MNPYRHPTPGLAGRLIQALANSVSLARVRHALFSRLPFVRLESDVQQVVYLTWLVDAATARRLLPEGLQCWEKEGKTPLTILTYRHGHFGPAFLGPLRKLFPSPLQSNWRLYLQQAPAHLASGRTVYFLRNVMDSALYALATRLFSDIMQTHLAARFVHRVRNDAIDVVIEAGAGSAPALACTASIAGGRTLPPPFAALFGSWTAAVDYLACQDSAIARAERLPGLAVARIALPIDVAHAVPLDVSAAACALLRDFPETEGPFGFLVRDVKFGVLSERVVL